MKKSIGKKTGLFLTAAILIAACSAQNKSAAFEEDSPSEAFSRVYDDAVYNAETVQTAAPDTAERKLVKQATVNIRVENMDTVDKSISGLMNKYGAYAASSSVDENFRNYSIRVPSAAYDIFLNEMDTMGRTLHRSESAEDVTLSYYDLEGRFATKKELLTTYQSYLGKAKNIEEILSVESRIADLQYEIDQIGQELRGLTNRIDYAAIELYVRPAAGMPYHGPSMGDRFNDIARDFKEFLAVAVVVLAGLVMYGIPLVLFAAFLYWLLLGRIGLLKKLWRAAGGKKQKPEKSA